MPGYEPRVFYCKNCDWMLGESYREVGKRITQLRVYRHARENELGVDLGNIILSFKYAVVQANDCSVLCEHCGAENTWYANQTAIEDILKRKPRQKHMKLEKQVLQESVN